MTYELQTKRIEILEANTNNWHQAKIEVKVYGWTTDSEIETQITEQAILWASDNGFEYETWEPLDLRDIALPAHVDNRDDMEDWLG